MRRREVTIKCGKRGVVCKYNEKESVSMGVMGAREEEREEEEGECQHEAGEEVMYQLQK